MTGKAPEPASDKGSSTASPAPSAAAPTPAPAPAQNTGSVTTGSTPPVAPAAPAQPAKAAAPPARAAAPAPRVAPAPRPVKNAALKTGSNGAGGGAAVGLAILALLVAVGAVGVGIYALDTARDAKSRAATAASAPAAVAPAPVATASTPAPAPTPTRVTSFTPEFVRTELKVPPATGCTAQYVDVDQLQLGVQASHEFYLSSCLGPTSVRIDRVTSVVPTTDNPTAEVCAAQLAGTNQNSELVLQARVGLTFCLLTTKSDTTQPQRLGIVEVRELGTDQSVTLAVSTYRVPGQ